MNLDTKKAPWLSLALAAAIGGGFVSVGYARATHVGNARPRAGYTAASKAAFLQVYKVLTSPRCANCHPAGDSPLQGDDGHVHLQNVKRGADGHGVTAMRCNSCHQDKNLPGENLPPGNPKWSLPAPEHKMVFVGRTPGQLCRQLRDVKQNGGRSLEQLFEHVSKDDLVGWAWDPGDGRTPPPLSRDETSKQMRTWIDQGAACPE
jgi:hypothetical protein